MENRRREIRVGDVVALYKRACNSKIYYFKVQNVEAGQPVTVRQMDVLVPDDYPDDLGNVAYYPDPDKYMGDETYAMHQTSCPWVLKEEGMYYVLWSGLNANLVEDFIESGLDSPHEDDMYEDPKFLKGWVSQQYPFFLKKLEAMKSDPKYEDYFD